MSVAGVYCRVCGDVFVPPVAVDVFYSAELETCRPCLHWAGGESLRIWSGVYRGGPDDLRRAAWHYPPPQVTVCP